MITGLGSTACVATMLKSQSHARGTAPPPPHPIKSRCFSPVRYVLGLIVLMVWMKMSRIACTYTHTNNTLWETEKEGDSVVVARVSVTSGLAWLGNGAVGIIAGNGQTSVRLVSHAPATCWYTCSTHSSWHRLPLWPWSLTARVQRGLLLHVPSAFSHTHTSILHAPYNGVSLRKGSRLWHIPSENCDGTQRGNGRNLEPLRGRFVLSVCKALRAFNSKTWILFTLFSLYLYYHYLYALSPLYTGIPVVLLVKPR